MGDTASSTEGINSPLATTEPPTIRRIPKACGSCRQSKLRCDGQRPCARCDKLGKNCVYVSRPRDPNEDRFERLEGELAQLRTQVASMHQTSQSPREYIPARVDDGSRYSAHSHDGGPTSAPLAQLSRQDSYGAAPNTNQPSSYSNEAHHLTGSMNQASPSVHSTSVTSPFSGLAGTRKRKRPGVEVRQNEPSDFITRGLITIEQAHMFWASFFGGCDRFVPVFDPSYDSFESVRMRSSFLFDSICTMGCTVAGTDPQLPHVLNFELKKLLNQVVMDRAKQSLEVVQALLVIACYSPERSLILSFATRLALDLDDLPGAFEQLTSSLMSADPVSDSQRAHLVRCSRTWFELLVLEHMLQVDAGKLPTFTAQGSSRRCRVLLQQTDTTPLDLRLLSQVELNYLRTKIHNALDQQGAGSDEDILDEIRDARIDIDLWFNDWKSYMENSPIAAIERPMLLVNLRVQRHWCEAMFYFRGLKCLGIDNIDAMSPAGRQLLSMAKASLKAHLATTLEEPNYYLPNLRFAMDFVWAKCAFCFLLVLKLTRLLPESDQDNYRLLEDGNKLYQQLSDAGTNAGSSTSRLYVQILGMCLEKYGRALQQHQQLQPVQSMGGTLFWESNANFELQSFVPEQFVFEWNFPGLNLWSSPTAWQEFFDGKPFPSALVCLSHRDTSVFDRLS